MLRIIFLLYQSILNIKHNYINIVLRRAFVLLMNLLLPIYLFCTRKGNEYKLCGKENPKVIVSLTSFPKRIKRVWLVIECMLHQSYKPDLIILWLSKEQFNTLELLPATLLSLQSRGLKIILCDGDIRSYKKYYYAMNMFPDSNVFTIDDDLFYPPNILEKTMKLHHEYPNSIIANYGSKVTFEGTKMMSYNSWKELDIIGEPCNSAFFGSGGGTLFPPNSLFAPLAFNKELFITLCPNADDIWLNVLSRMNSTKVVVNNPPKLIPVLNWHNTTLWGVNESLNDVQFDNLKIYFKKIYNKDIEILFQEKNNNMHRFA